MATNEVTSTDGMAAKVEIGRSAMATNGKESKRKITAPNLIRWAGLAALVAGIIFAGIQPIHPPDVLSSVTTGEWAIITTLKTVMCLFFLLGIAGLYARQVGKAGWLGLAGFLLLTLSWWLQTAFVFAEAFILPLLATTASKFVDGLLGTLAAGRASEVNLGALPAIYRSEEHTSELQSRQYLVRRLPLVK